MCSIFSVFDIKTVQRNLRKNPLELSRLMRHRGPDWSASTLLRRAILARERLSIVDVNAGAQPCITPETHVLALNGEIITTIKRYARIVASLRFTFQTGSDCELFSLYQEKGPDFLDDLRGCSPSPCMTAKRRLSGGRDHIGIIPLLYGLYDEFGNFYVASKWR